MDYDWSQHKAFKPTPIRRARLTSEFCADVDPYYDKRGRLRPEYQEIETPKEEKTLPDDQSAKLSVHGKKHGILIPEFDEANPDAIEQWLLSQGDELLFALDNCEHLGACFRCHESRWRFISLSPNRKAATFRCDYCNRKEIIAVNDAQEPTDTRTNNEDLRAQNLKPRERIIFELLDLNVARSVDDLIVQSGLQANEVLTDLLMLELQKLCRQLPGKRYLKT